ncbi:uncharacterized protein [Euwallacea similis]|uniref:uncharacterized protein isoform X1 n=1 Tax=Euwallacea similis TaxID=1736056 RepID=UPI00344D66F1
MVDTIFLFISTVFTISVGQYASENIGYDYTPPKLVSRGLDFHQGKSFDPAAGYHPVGNPLTTALLLSTFLEVPSTQIGVGNHPDQGPVNPYIALLLSQYGRYLPIHIVGSRGLYYYAAANNYHNNKPFGSYKVYENAK